MYLIIDIEDDIQIGITNNLEYYYLDNWYVPPRLLPTDAFSATAIKYKNIFYNLIGKEAYPEAAGTVRLVWIDAPDATVNTMLEEEKHASYIDYLSAMTGIDLPDEEEEELEETEEGN